MIKIGVDANGGDLGVKATVPGAMRAIKMFKDIEIVLFGDEEKIKPLLTNSERISIVHTKDTLDMGEHDPMRAIRKNKTASLCLAMTAAKNKEVDAVVTSGPTQCVVMGAHLIIRRLPQMERVALCPIVPNLDGKPRLLLDVGANVELEARHLCQFAVFATVACEEIFGIHNPSVGLLNIGSEESKGRDLDREAYKELSNLNGINFYGNVEPDQILDCPTNIVVADGYSGNICLKSMEGSAKIVSKMLKEEIKSSFAGMLGALIMHKNLNRLKKRMDTKEVGGAMIFGIGSSVVKAHGNSDEIAIANAIKQARIMVESNIIEKVINRLPKEEADKVE